MSADLPDGTLDDRTLQVYLLGRVDFDTLLRFQRWLHFEISGDRKKAALIVCEHSPLITVGRQGSRSHIRLEPDDLRLRGWPIRWVNRGGGCILHLPGQLALYPILPLDQLRLGITDYLRRLNDTVRGLLGEFSVHAGIQTADDGLRVGPRLLSAIGISVRDWVTSYGVYLNVQPALDPFHHVNVSAHDQVPMTSLERERRGPVRPALVRERLIEQFRARFGFSRVALFSSHPALGGALQRCPAKKKVMEIREGEAPAEPEPR
jgi:lipoyl(octanoyl) transferase